MPRTTLQLSALWLLLAPATVCAQAPADAIAQLRARLERLEEENRELKAAVHAHRASGDLPQAGSYFAAALPAAGDESSDWRIRSIVEEYLAEREAQLVAAGPPAGGGPDGGGDANGQPIGQDLTMTARWNNGLELATKDRAFRVHVGGRWQFDTSWLSADQAVQNHLPGDVRYHDGVDFRRARLRIDGTMYEVIEFATEYDFVNGFRERNAANVPSDINVTAITDLWLQFSHTPIGNIRIGNQKEAIGFEHIVSSRFLPFLERSYNQDTFYGGAFNGFTPGASLSRNIWNDRASWNIGVYKTPNNVFGFNTFDGDYTVTGRVTWLPVYEDQGRQLVHLGLSARQSTLYDDRMRFRTRDAIRAGVATQWPVPADITVFGDTMQWINAELAAVQGPWTLQAEWLVSLTHDAQWAGRTGQRTGPVAENLLYHGGYVQLLYFLTGESETYAFDKMAFDRVKPLENFFWVPGQDGSLFGRGAWQIGARYNFLDLNDQGINGGQLHNFTAGLNWFFNPNMKWQFNYMATFRDVSDASDGAIRNGTGWIHGWGMRFAQDF